jgi:hypothetical protein
LSGKEGTFLICSFWLASALRIVGKHQRAVDLFERLLRIASPLGLYAEEFDVDTGFHVGDFSPWSTSIVGLREPEPLQSPLQGNVRSAALRGRTRGPRGRLPTRLDDGRFRPDRPVPQLGGSALTP